MGTACRGWGHVRGRGWGQPCNTRPSETCSLSRLLPPANLPGRGWVPGGEQGGSRAMGTRVGKTQKPPPHTHPHLIPFLPALKVGDRDYSLSKLYAQPKDCWDLSMACKHTLGRFPAQTPALFQAAETKGCSYIFLQEKATSMKLSLKIKKSLHLSLGEHKRAAAGNVSSCLPVQSQSSKLGFPEKGLCSTFQEGCDGAQQRCNSLNGAALENDNVFKAISLL